VDESLNEPRKPRADSRRNHERLLAAAKAAFAEQGANAPLEAIARRAGVGVGTLYRHFPAREALLAAVYQEEVRQLCAAADSLLAARRPYEALEAWLGQLVDYLATKRVILPALKAASAGEAPLAASASGAIMAAMGRLAKAAAASGEIRPEVTPEDMQRLTAGLSFGYDQPGWEPSARRLIRVLMDGLKPALDSRV
jgi:AcrR family transcriptional regulator